MSRPALREPPRPHHPQFSFSGSFRCDPECLLLSVPRGAQPPWGELAGHGPSGPSFPSSLEEPGSAEGAHGEALGPRGSRVPGTCLSATGLFLPSHDRARKAVPLPLKVTILYFLAQGRNSDSINAKSDTGRGAAGGTVPSLRPHQCRGLAGRTLTSGNNGFYRHLGSKRACSRGYAGGAGRAGLAPGGLSPETAASSLTLAPLRGHFPGGLHCLGVTRGCACPRPRKSDRATSPEVLSWWPRLSTHSAYVPGSGGQSKTTPAGSRRSRQAPGGPSRARSSSSGRRKGRLPGAPGPGRRAALVRRLQPLPSTEVSAKTRLPGLWQETAGVPPGNRSGGGRRGDPRHRG